MGTREVRPAIMLRIMMVMIALCYILKISETMLKGSCFRLLLENLLRIRLVENMGSKESLYRKMVYPKSWMWYLISWWCIVWALLIYWRRGTCWERLEGIGLVDCRSSCIRAICRQTNVLFKSCFDYYQQQQGRIHEGGRKVKEEGLGGREVEGWGKWVDVGWDLLMFFNLWEKYWIRWKIGNKKVRRKMSTLHKKVLSFCITEWIINETLISLD